MKLGEALRLRQDLKKSLSNLRYRITSNIEIEEGTEPNEDPKKLVYVYLEKSKELKIIETKINLSNAKIVLKDDKTMNEALAERDHFKTLISFFEDVRDLAVPSTETRYHQAHKEVINMRSLFKASEYQEKVDKVSNQLRELDFAIQAKNWSCDLINEINEN